MELVVAIAIVSILAAILLPSLAQAKSRALRAPCASQLRQIGMALNAFAAENGDRFPSMATAPAGGPDPFGNGPWRGRLVLSPRPFQVLSNDLGSPAVLVCPGDRRRPAPTFAALDQVHLSYFMSLEAKPADPLSLVAGDRNLTNVASRAGSAPAASSGFRLAWTRELHNRSGNVLFGDSHVEHWRNPSMEGDPKAPVASQPLRGQARVAVADRVGVAPPADGFAGDKRQPIKTGLGGGLGGGRTQWDLKVAPSAGVPVRESDPGSNWVARPNPSEVLAITGSDGWETPTNHSMLLGAKLAYLACLLWAVIVLLLYLLRARRRR